MIGIEKLKLGEILVKSGAISLLDLETFLQEQEELRDERGYQTKLGTLLLEHKLVNEETLALAFAEQQAIDYQDLKNFQPDLNILEKIPFSILKSFRFVPIFLDSERLVIAIHDPIDTFLFDLLYKALGLHIDICSSARSNIDKCHSECIKMVSDSGRINQDFDVDFDEFRLLLKQETKQQEPDIPEVSIDRSLNHLSFEEILKESFEVQGAVSLKLRSNQKKASLFIKVRKWERLGYCSQEHYQGLLLRVKSLCKDQEYQDQFFSQYFVTIPLPENTNRSFSIFLIPNQGFTELLIEPFPFSPQPWTSVNSGLLSQERDYFSSLNLKYKGGWILGPATSGKTNFYNSLLWDQCEKGLSPISFESNSNSCGYGLWPKVQLDEERNQLQSLGSFRGPGAELIGIDELHPDELGIYLRLVGDRPFLATSNGQGIFPALAQIEKQATGLGFILDSLEFIISLKLVPGICPYCTRPHSPGPEELVKIGLKPESLKKPFFVTNDGCDFCENRGYSESTLIYELLKINSQVIKIIQENPLGNEIASHLVRMGMLFPASSIAREKLYRGKISLKTYLQILQKKI